MCEYAYTSEYPPSMVGTIGTITSYIYFCINKFNTASINMYGYFKPIDTFFFVKLYYERFLCLGVYVLVVYVNDLTLV